MNKMRQFSFQDFAVSKQSEATLDSINSALSSCNNRNIVDQQPLDAKVLSSTENQPRIQSPLGNSKTSPKKVLSARPKQEGKENINTELTGEKITTAKQASINEAPTGDQQDSRAIFQEKWINDFKQNEDHLKENWKKMNKINKLLEEHQKKKASRKSARNPLGKIDENTGLKEINPNIEESPIIKGAKSKDNRADQVQEDNEQIPTEIEVLEGSYSYEYFDERPEQVFSAALVEPFSPTLKFPLPTTNKNTSTHTSRREEDTPELGTQIQNNLRDIDNSIQPEVFHPLSSETEQNEPTEPEISEMKEKNKAQEKRLPIEERLRLKEIEREIKLTYLREERSRNMMKEMKNKPQISENSIKIAMNSRRVKENEEVLDRLAASDSKKSILLGTSKYTEQSEYHSQSKMSNTRSNWDRSTLRPEKSIGTENDSNINLYKRNGRQASITATSQHTQPFESYRPTLDGQGRLDTIQRTEEGQEDYHRSRKQTDENGGLLDMGQGHSGEASLHKQASDRLHQALAKKTTSQASGTSPISMRPGDYIKSESSVGLSPISVYPQSTNMERKKELQDGYAENPDYDQEMPAQNSVQTEQGSMGSVRTPKHVYLRVSRLPEEIENQSRQENSRGNQGHQHRHMPDQKFNQMELYDAEEGDYEKLYRIHNMEDNEHTYGREEHYGEIKKRSTRQPTFGGSPSRKPTNQSSKLSSYEGHPGMVTGCFNDKVIQKVEDHSIENSSRISTGRPTNESLINSWKLRQEKLANGELGLNRQGSYQSSSGLRLKDQNQVYKRNLTIGDENPWGDIDVYKRNSMWLSAKNSKVAAMNVMKENQEMRECTFHPHVTDKSSNRSKIELRSGSQMLSERVKDRPLGVQRKTVTSYKELNARKLRTFDQQQTCSVTSPSTYVDQVFTEGNVHELEGPIDSVQQEGDRFMSL